MAATHAPPETATIAPAIIPVTDVTARPGGEGKKTSAASARSTAAPAAATP